MSQTEQSGASPEKVVHSPETDTVHRSGSGLEPACSDRLHNADAEWRLATPSRAEGKRCGHPECFGGDLDG